MKTFRSIMLATVFGCACAWTACTPRGEDLAEQGADTADGTAPGAIVADEGPVETTYQAQDSVIFEQRMTLARAQRLDTLEFGRTVVALGRTFVGAPYKPATLELDGPERLVINLRELDCVTFVESMLAMARVIHTGEMSFAAFQRELVRMRYRGGRLDGYPSRLHYFSEWIADNTEKGVVKELTRSLGGIPDSTALSFMTTHPEAYRQFKDADVPAAIGAIEQRLSRNVRYYLPESRIAAAAADIRDGDVIAATSTLEGLDVAHTGLAFWHNGKLHLMHAPLIGTVVEISEHPISDRIQRISAQDGIMVARPQPPARTPGQPRPQ